MTNQQKRPQTISWIKSALFKKGIKPNRRAGQNFLIDQNLIIFIVNAGEIDDKDIILEIGSGTGTLTQMIAEKARFVVSVEIDNRLYELSSDILASYKNIVLLNKDVLKNKSHLEPSVISAVQNIIGLPENQTGKDNLRLKVISNLPYSISTPVIINLLESGLPINLMMFTLQKDITNRLTAKPGSKDYGILSIIAQHFSKIEILKQLPPDVFWPSPNVNSSIVKLEVLPKDKVSYISNYHLFKRVVSAIFTTRRKTIYNSFIKSDLPLCDQRLIRALKECGINTLTRGESLTVEKMIELTNVIDNILQMDIRQ